MLPVLPQPGLLRGPRETQRCDPNSSWPPLLVWVDDTGAPVTKIELLPSYSTVALIDEPAEVADPWDLPELRDTGIKWSGKRQGGTPISEGLGSRAPQCCPLSCRCSEALHTKVLVRDTSRQPWRLRVQAQCENWGIFCSLL